MKGLKIIPMFLLLMAMTYAGMLFVQANNEEVMVRIGSYQAPSVAIGFVVLTSIFIGMLLCGMFCSIELLALYVQNKRLKRRILTSQPPANGTASTNTGDPTTANDIVPHRTSGRFT